jgi:hypothetical protein
MRVYINFGRPSRSNFVVNHDIILIMNWLWRRKAPTRKMVTVLRLQHIEREVVEKTYLSSE